MFDVDNGESENISRVIGTATDLGGTNFHLSLWNFGYKDSFARIPDEQIAQSFLDVHSKCEYIQRRGLRGSNRVCVAAGTDTLFTLYEAAQILRQVESATKVFSRYTPSG